MPEREVEPVVEDFDGPGLDRARWLPHYLPQWSSRAASAASWQVADSRLRLDIPVDHPVWCADDHRPPIRVSALQSGCFSGPVGSTVGQQPYRPGLTVREAQRPFTGWLVQGGRVELRARADLSPRSMVSLWLVGFEDQPDRCAEICVMEVFGSSVADGQVDVGSGLHAFRDPRTPEDFATTRLPLDVSEPHTYAADWTPGAVTFSVDGHPTRHCADPPDYPLQLMLAVFDFPDWSTGDDADLEPAFEVDWLRFVPQA